MSISYYQSFAPYDRLYDVVEQHHLSHSWPWCFWWIGWCVSLVNQFVLLSWTEYSVRPLKQNRNYYVSIAYWIINDAIILIDSTLLIHRNHQCACTLIEINSKSNEVEIETLKVILLCAALVWIIAHTTILECDGKSSLSHCRCEISVGENTQSHFSLRVHKFVSKFQPKYRHK